MSELRYLSGFGNEFATEARPGVLPHGQNSPQRPALGLYAEGISGAAFTAPRAENRRTWTYRIRPSAMIGPFRRIDGGLVRSAPFDEVPPPPDRLRWNPLPMPANPCDFVDGLVTMGGNGDVSARTGMAVHLYAANRSMRDRVFASADGEFLIVPQEGRLLVRTELGAIEVKPGEIVVVPRAIKFAVELPDGKAKGYACENYGAFFRLPELGAIGSNGLANPRDFLAPEAAFEDRDAKVQFIQKFEGHLWTTEFDHSPFDVVAWHGNYVPYKYDLANFMALGSLTFDHADPSIFTVLTSPSGLPGVANVDFVIFPPRWQVADHTFRPPWFHRNVMSEYMGLIHGAYEAKAEGFVPGGASLHNSHAPHGPDRASHAQASDAELRPFYLGDTLAFMFETRLVIRPTRYALETPALQRDYHECWSGFPNLFRRGG